MSYPIRSGTVEDFPELTAMDGLAFGHSYSAEEIEDTLASIDIGRFLVATDAERIVGAAGEFRFDVTVPGGAALPVPGVTWVSVAVTHRRRGILTALMDRQLRQYRANGDPFAVLTASEGGIYGRFGYGPATRVRAARVDRRRARLGEVVDSSAVRLVSIEQARTALPDLHQRWCAQTPGAVSRSGVWWEQFFRDRESRRGGMTERHYLLHPDGYLALRAQSGGDGLVVKVVDDAIAAPTARAAIWQVLLSFDLYVAVETRRLPLDDPLPLLLTDPRRVETQSVDDGLWMRLLDVERCLSARTYGLEVDAVIEVRDRILGDARYRLRGGPDGARCVRTDDPPDLRCGVAALGSAYFGGHRLAQLVAAGRAEADGPATLRRLDLAFQAEREPVHGTEF